MESKKNSSVDSDDSITRTGFVLTGLVVIMATMFCLVEYNNVDIVGATIDSKLSDIQDEEVIEVNPNTPPPPPPPPPPPAPPEEVEILEEEDEREETKVIIVDQESATNVVLDIPEEEEEPEVEQIFDVVEEQASFPGGLQAMMEFLGKNTKYPEMARENGIQGRVYIQFVVYKDGSIKDVKVMKGRHATLDKEAVRVVKSMPKWVPGKQRGKSVNSRFTLPVKFKIQ
jgi:protein TonB